MRSYTFHINTAESTVDFKGVDMGGKATVVALNRVDGYITVRVEGGNGWAGLGQQAYHPTTLYTFKVNPDHIPGRDQDVDTIILVGEKVIETPIRTKTVNLVPTTRLVVREGR